MYSSLWQLKLGKHCPSLLINKTSKLILKSKSKLEVLLLALLKFKKLQLQPNTKLISER